MVQFLFTVCLLVIYATADGALAGGRPNAISEGQNAFAGVVNPANAVWIADRFDVGVFLVHQKSSLTNEDNNPFFPPGKIGLTHHSKYLFSPDCAIHKRFNLKGHDASLSLAAYSTPSQIKLRTKQPLPLSGTTPLFVTNKTEVLSAVFSFKIASGHSLGFSIDYFYFSHRRNGFQNSDNPLRSVSPGHVTNNGVDHSSGIGFSLGWRWNITENLKFGLAWIKKSYCGQYRKYRGYEPHHAKNYIPQTVGAGFSYRFTPKLAGRLEVLWVNLGNLPGANNNVLSNGQLNFNKRGSKKSPGPGLQDATYINLGIGYQLNEMLSLGVSYSHRIKLKRKHSTILSRTYILQTNYDILALGADFRYKKHNLFFIYSYSFKNRSSGLMPIEVGGGHFTGRKQQTSFSFSWGYLY